MLIYSNAINAFIRNVHSHALKILYSECRLEIKGKKVLFKGYLYPLSIVVFNNPNQLGYFDYKYFQIGINQILFERVDQNLLLKVLRHELAHFMTYLNYGEGVTAHGEEFKCICEKFNWPKEISKASLDLKNLIPTNNGKDLKVRKQIKKLFELAKSSNLHEAQEATRKANELLAKYNLENALEFSEEENVYVKDVLIYKKNNKKLHAIYEILTYFNVSPFFSKGQGECKLGVLGDLLSVESADYIANFLDHEFERLWKINKKNNSNLKGSVMKNSFFTGLSFGFCEKLKAQKYQYQIHGYNLVQIDKRLEQMRRIAFPRLGHTSSSAQVNNQSRNLGIESGRNLNIRHGLNMNQTLFLPGEKN